MSEHSNTLYWLPPELLTSPAHTIARTIHSAMLCLPVHSDTWLPSGSLTSPRHTTALTVYFVVLCQSNHSDILCLWPLVLGWSEIQAPVIRQHKQTDEMTLQNWKATEMKYTLYEVSWKAVQILLLKSYKQKMKKCFNPFVLLHLATNVMKFQESFNECLPSDRNIIENLDIVPNKKLTFPTIQCLRSPHTCYACLHYYQCSHRVMKANILKVTKSSSIGHYVLTIQSLYIHVGHICRFTLCVQ